MSAISKATLAGAQTDENLNVTTPTEDQARDLVKRGKTVVAVIIPKGFGDAAGKAFFGNGEKPPLNLVHDPSRSIELAMVRGILTQHVMEAVSREMFGGDQGRQLIEQTLPQVQSSSMPADQKRLLVDVLALEDLVGQVERLLLGQFLRRRRLQPDHHQQEHLAHRK